MDITRRTPISELMRSHPEARDILSWYGVDLNGRSLGMNLDQLSDSYDLDLQDLLAELKTMLDDSFQPMSLDDDDWG